ncbi:pyridoxamine 5'-phosphate oxidase [Aliiroseovarius sp. PTFE2010]|uniref:pyridoxamine 5'-phosphate oxidase n=1 Tax=Aliiroseovarius sp. PTFE2010 TaxID=3417190 RepID=UPI003CFAE85C
MTKRDGIFAGEDPFVIARRWLGEAEAHELNDPNAMALSTVDDEGLPNVRVVLCKAIEDDGFTFFTNYESQKGRELASGKAAAVFHWKSLQRQVRIRGTVIKEAPEISDAYYASRSLGSRIGAWASQQSRPLESKAALAKAVAAQGLQHGTSPRRPPFWGGYRILPLEFEFWAAGEFRLHDRFRWRRETVDNRWAIVRLNP